MLSFRTPEHRFQFRAAAIVQRRGSILLHRAEHEDFWTLPGGRVEAGECAQSAVAREFNEELGESLVVGSLAIVTENFFHYAGESYHELGFFFRATLVEQSRLAAGDGPFPGQEDDVGLIFQWFAPEAIRRLTVQPAFLKTALAGPLDGMRHIVQRDQD